MLMRTFLASLLIFVYCHSQKQRPIQTHTHTHTPTRAVGQCRTDSQREWSHIYYLLLCWMYVSTFVCLLALLYGKIIEMAVDVCTYTNPYYRPAFGMSPNCVALSQTDTRMTTHIHVTRAQHAHARRRLPKCWPSNLMVRKRLSAWQLRGVGGVLARTSDWSCVLFLVIGVPPKWNNAMFMRRITLADNICNVIIMRMRRALLCLCKLPDQFRQKLSSGMDVFAF